MPRWHIDTGKKPTGGVIKQHRKKKKYMIGSEPLLVKIGKEKRDIVRTKGGNIKVKAISVEYANVLNPKTKKVKKVRILSVVDNPANPHFVRRGIVTKGCIVDTELGKARVTSRPTQHGIVNAILIVE